MELYYCTLKFLVCFFLLAIVIFPVSAIEDKCSACKAVAVELESALSNEKTRNHLDMRHRLDSTGKREGKLIDYRLSELRVVELLDGLCEKMNDYTFIKDPSGKGYWMKVEDWEKAVLTIEKQEAQAHAKAMTTFCGRLLEQTEEELADRIKTGTVVVGAVENTLCRDISKLCAPMQIIDQVKRGGILLLTMLTCDTSETKCPSFRYCISRRSPKGRPII